MNTFYNLLLKNKNEKMKRPIWCEYFECDGGQWVDTGVKCKNTISLNMVVTINTENVKNGQKIFGFRDSATQNNFTVFSEKNSGVITIDFNNSEWKKYRLYQTIEQNDNSKLVKISLTNSSKIRQITTLDTQAIAKNDVVCPDVFDGGNLYLLNINGQHYIRNNFNGKFHSCQIYDNGKIIRNFRPCLNPYTLRPAIYDVVEGKYYYNMGEGDFKYNIEFIALDYIENVNEDVFFDTGKNINWGTDKCRYVCSIQTLDSTASIFGSRVDYDVNSPCMMLINNSLRADWTTPKIEVPIKKDEILDMTIQSGEFICNKNKYTSTVTRPDELCPYTFYLVGLNDDGNHAYYNGSAKQHFYECQLFQSGTLTGDYIPVRKNDGTICIYNFIDNKYIMNSGTALASINGYRDGYRIGVSLKPNTSAIINTEAIPEETTEIKCYVSNARSSQWVFGSRYDSSKDCCGFFASSEGVCVIGFGGFSRATDLDISSLWGSNPVEIFLSKTSLTIGKDIGTNDVGFNKFIEPSPVFLFTMYTKSYGVNAIDTRHFKGKMYSYLMCSQNKPVRIMIPASKDNFVGMLDIVENKQYNSLEEKFIIDYS